MLHRYVGVVAALAMVACAVMVWRRTRAGAGLRKLSLIWVAMAVVQVTLGIFSILSHRKVDVTTAHVAVGTLTLAVGWLAVLITARQTARAGVTVQAGVTEISPAQFKHA